ncbi:molybdate ABC transporter substrate-binding protein [Sediminispirochaeta smaragdinae]|uniref:Molybdenum ABC transporter, periplasmic molybdate-binding protein n=1 Tax=Sediminispirochaeta smaragdinae (strain DSM 11293 / JCM 15392 / SEBR 4228) TaxID=573413 RepID=E1R2K2_SEDSS|nr:molybdate ABC transporter substrate-binding protein [Sediminispirochaeta smaragdinae]ADK82562.1 molybdenum ABC transporter, periplasmic molybdate-binding protein [Sediminispirochaeta smaragdinae DSM 11293]
MKRGKTIVLIVLAIVTVIGSVSAESMTIAAGAGYRALVDDLSQLFTSKTGITVEHIYGNMGQVTTQAKRSGVVDLVVGDKSFFDKVKLPFDQEYIVGNGRLVLAAAKDAGPADLGRLTAADVDRIALPDPKMAIYGIAATEYLEHSGLADKVADKLIQVGTVPQVSAYLISGEVDFGFINLTDVLAIKEKIAGYVDVPESYYSPIYIVARSMPDAPAGDATVRFGEFLDSPQAREIVKRHGL